MEVKVVLHLITFKVQSAIALMVAPCEQKSGGVGQNLCIQLRVADGKRAQFRETYTTIANLRTGASFSSVFDTIHYDVHCEVSPEGKRSCGSTEKSTVDGEFQVEEIHRFTSGKNEHVFHRYSFASSLAFKGTTIKIGPNLFRRVEEAERWRKYEAIVVRDVVLSEDMVISLPTLLVDNVEIRFPPIKLRVDTEEVCFAPCV